jgi:hypothetical protein
VAWEIPVCRAASEIVKAEIALDVIDSWPDSSTESDTSRSGLGPNLDNTSTLTISEADSTVGDQLEAHWRRESRLTEGAASTVSIVDELDRLREVEVDASEVPRIC